MNAPAGVLADGTTSMYWAGRAAYQSGLTLAANPWDGNKPSEARADWSWRKGFASAEHAALAKHHFVAARGQA